MKKTLSLALAAVLALPLSAMASAPTVSWTNWTSGTAGSLTQNATPITVTYIGTNAGRDTTDAIYDHPASFTNVDVTNTPTMANGTIKLTGGAGSGTSTFHFSQAVINPYIELFSVGAGGSPVTINFLNGEHFTILSQGAGHWGGGTLTQSGDSVTGAEGNGLLQFTGSFTDISFTTPNFENYYGATVGAALVASVPEPETYAMMLAGLMLVGLVARRRKA